MGAAHKKVVLREFGNRLSWGYLPFHGILGVDGQVQFLNPAGQVKLLSFNEIKTIAYVKDFNLADTSDPERMGRRTFAARPAGEGLGLRLVFTDGEKIEGTVSFDTGFLDSLLLDHGFFLVPPDARSNTQRLFVPRFSLRRLELIHPAARQGRRRSRPDPGAAVQAGLFERLEE